MTSRIATLLFALFSAFQVVAADIYVDQNAPAGGDGTSWATAFTSIEQALLIAAANDVVNIAEGTYSPIATLNIIVPLTINGGFPTGGGIQDPDIYRTEVRGDANPAIFLRPLFEIQVNADTTFDGLAVTQTSAGFFLYSSLVLRRSELSYVNGTNVDSGGIVVQGIIQNVTIEDSFVAFNEEVILFERGATGGSVANVTIDNSVFEDNTEAIVNIFTTGNQTFSLTNSNFRRNTSQSSLVRLANVAQNMTVTVSACLFEENQFANTAFSIAPNGSVITVNGVTVRNQNHMSPKIFFSFSDVTATLTNLRYEENRNQMAISGTNTKITLLNSNFDKNESEGGIIAANTGSSLTMDRVEFTQNLTSESSFSFINISESDIIIFDCLFDSNTMLDAANPNSPNNWLISVRDGNLLLEDSVFQSNIMSPTARLVSNTNQPADPSDDNSIIRRCTFTNNGGITVEGQYLQNYLMEDCTITGNQMLEVFNITDARILNCHLFGNTSTRFENLIRAANLVNGLIENTSIISDVQAGDLELLSNSADFTSSGMSNLTIRNTTISAQDFLNTHVEIRNSGNNSIPLKVENSIVWSGKNDLTQSALATFNTGGFDIVNSLIKGVNPPGAGNLDGTLLANAPQFFSPVNVKFTEKPCSPTVNAGNNSFIAATTDSEGNPRVFETTVDMGAFELQEAKQTNCPISTTEPGCTSLSRPLANAMDVPVNIDFEWPAATDAEGYLIAYGTTPNGIELSDVIDVGPATTHTPTANLPGGTTIYVRIYPYNSLCETVCTESMFTTVSNGPPPCTDLTMPTANATDVAIDTEISWRAIADATGYQLIVEAPMGTTFFDQDVGNVTSFDLPTDLPNGVDVTVTIIPRNTNDPAVGCSPETFRTIALPINADDLPDVNRCDSFVLPTLSANNNYFTASNGGGIMLNAGETVTTSQTIYVFAQMGSVTDEKDFEVTIVETPTAHIIQDVVVCTSYNLPVLPAHNSYYEGPNASGTMLMSGDRIDTDSTIYIFAEAGTAPDNCTDESSFTVTITGIIEADEPEDVVTCSEYILPDLSVNNTYYTEAAQGGIQLNAGDAINNSQRVYVFAAQGDCSDENSFFVTIDDTAQVTTIENVTACSFYALPELANGDYFTEPNGEGKILFPGDVLQTEQTVYIYLNMGECSNESSFTIQFDESLCPEPMEEEQEEEECKIEFPNFFTPNGDGINDDFMMIRQDCGATGELRIYDRYGKLVFQSNDTSRGWDGIFQGRQLPTSDYWYQYIDANTNEVIRSHFTLKR